MMDRNRLSEILDACGANPARWPKGEREAARGLLAQDARSQAQARHEAELDDWLKDWGAPAPRPQAMAALLAASRVTAQAIGVQAIGAQAVAGRDAGWRRDRWLAHGGAVGLAASIMALLMAVSEPTPQQPVDMTDSLVASLAFSTDLSDGWL